MCAMFVVTLHEYPSATVRRVTLNSGVKSGVKPVQWPGNGLHVKDLDTVNKVKHYLVSSHINPI